ncbi:MAG: hypothetical protein AAFO07_23620 [Bacteroidota bacterium]
MLTDKSVKRTKAHISRSAIERLYISMRHLFTRGAYKPLGVSGESMIEALRTLNPEIYGTINDPEKVELNGLFYVFQRLPKGIEECRFIKLISKEGFENSQFEPIIPPKRRRNSYRIDTEEMHIEMTRGRSDIYDILTHLTFLYVESEKIRRNSEGSKGEKQREWKKLEEIVELESTGQDFNSEVAYTYLSTLLGRTYEDTVAACKRFAKDPNVNSIFHITYWLGKISTEEHEKDICREISFSSALRERIGHHHYGELWADKIKTYLYEEELLQRPIHIISANLHSVMNSLFGSVALNNKVDYDDIEDLAGKLSEDQYNRLRQQVHKVATKHGMHEIYDTSGTNIAVQIFDSSKFPLEKLAKELQVDPAHVRKNKPLILVMDYAFGEQAFETLDELLKPFETGNERIPLNVESISIMGKAGILQGGKGDIMVPTAHVMEGSGDNYPFINAFTSADFEGNGLGVYEGPMITVLGTSLQNKDILRYFLKSSWRGIGLEMEGSHYQKAIQSASKIRKSISADVKLRYAYYASDNPLETGSTLASGGLGRDGVKPTYLITLKILNDILS